jgi:hypothetical protein
MKDKILKYSIYILGGVCLYIYFAVRFHTLYNVMVAEKLVPHYWDKIKYGEQYYFSFISHFREKNLPGATTKHQYSDKQPSINEAEIFAFGDSFFDIARPAQYPTNLAEKLHKKVYFGYVDFPLQHLNKNNYTDTTSKIMIMGYVERFIPMKFSTFRDTSYTRVNERSKAYRIAKNIKDMIFYREDEEFYDALLKRSYITTEIYSAIATLKFDMFDYISKFTPVYYLGDTIPWLFHDNSVNDQNSSFYYQHSNDEVRAVANTLDSLSKELKRMYNITLVFMPIPSKYTICHRKLNNHRYNNFIPRLQKKLAKRNVHYIDLYSDFITSKELLYFGTDGHWNEKGMRLTVDKTVKYLRNENLIN